MSRRIGAASGDTPSILAPTYPRGLARLEPRRSRADPPAAAALTLRGNAAKVGSSLSAGTTPTPPSDIMALTMPAPTIVYAPTLDADLRPLADQLRPSGF